jgi:hypothetical protein
MCQNDTIVFGGTARRLAEEHGVSASTINRDAAFARDVDVLKRNDPALADQVLLGKLSLEDALNPSDRLTEEDNGRCCPSLCQSTASPRV